MYRRLVDTVRDDPEVGFLGAELLLAAVVLGGVGLTLLSPLAPSLPLADIGFPAAAVATVLLTATSLLAGARRIVRFVTGRGGLEIESFWRMLEVMFAFFIAGIVALAVELGQYAQAVPNPRGGGGVAVGLFLAFVLAGVGLAVIVCLRGMWRVVSAEIQAALGGV